MPDQSQDQRPFFPEETPEDNHTQVFTLSILEMALEMLRTDKPADRGELTRRYAIVITEMEKVVAYFKTFIYNREQRDSDETVLQAFKMLEDQLRK